jgi:hypothetical protein
MELIVYGLRTRPMEPVKVRGLGLFALCKSSKRRNDDGKQGQTTQRKEKTSQSKTNSGPSTSSLNPRITKGGAAWK